MNEQFVAPQYGLKAYNCPHCGAYSTQSWLMSSHLRGRQFGWQDNVKDIAISICQLCGESAVWTEDLNSLDTDDEYLAGASPGYLVPAPDFDAGAGVGSGTVSSQQYKRPTRGTLIYPTTSPAPKPSKDMPEEIRADYLEARDIVNASPRGAAALLRLCVQKLMSVLGEKGKDINDDIASLVKKGLPTEIQQALDSLRVIGNEAVHPGTIDLNDNRETALALFDLLNFIVEQTITRKKSIENIYNNLPQSKLDAITKRDGK